MRTFDVHRPETVPQAVAMLAGDARPLAGGMSLLPSLRLRLAAADALVDLSSVGGLTGIARSGAELRIGAMTTHDAVARSAEVAAAIPALAALAGKIGDPQVRNRGTIGGSIANADPAADYPAAVLALGATIVTDRRMIAADDFFRGLFETALAPGEIITAVSFPIPDAAGYAKLPNPASRFAIVGVFVAKFASGVRVGVTGAGPCAFRETLLEEALSRAFTPEAIARVSIDPAGLSSDIHADAEYRAHLVTVLAKRAVASALARG